MKKPEIEIKRDPPEGIEGTDPEAVIDLAWAVATLVLGHVPGVGSPIGGETTGGCHAYGNDDAACSFGCDAGNVLSLSVEGENKVSGSVNCGGARFICGPRDASCAVPPGCCAETRGSGICHGHSNGWFRDYVTATCTAAVNTPDAAAAPPAFTADAAGRAAAQAAIADGLLTSVLVLRFTPEDAAAFACDAAGCRDVVPVCRADEAGYACFA